MHSRRSIGQSAANGKSAGAYVVRCLGCGAMARLKLECPDLIGRRLRCLACDGEAVLTATADARLSGAGPERAAA